MNERDEFGYSSEEFLLSVKKYEEQLRNNKPLFFDLNTFEDLIEYYELQGKTSRAMEAAEYAISIYPFSASMLIKKASLLFQYRKHDEALRYLTKAESIEPSELGIFLLRADIFLHRGKLNEAVNMIKHAMKIAEPDELSDLWLELSDVYEHTNEYSKVFDCLKSSLIIDPNNEEALNRMWYSVDLSKRHEDSIDFHQKLIDDTPYSYLAWQNLGLAFYGLKMYEKAAEAFEFVIAINETYDLAYRDCAECFFKLANYPKAIEYYHKAIHYSQPFEDLYYCIGECYEKQKDFEKARIYFRKALSVEPEMDIAMYRIGVTFSKEKQFHHALSFFKKAMRVNPTNTTFIVAAAKAAGSLHDIHHLLDITESLYTLSSSNKNLKAIEQVTELLLKFECLPEAKDLIATAKMLRGENIHLTLLHSVLLFKSGSRQHAVELLSQVLFADKSRAKLFFRLMPEMKKDNEVLRIIDIYT